MPIDISTNKKSLYRLTKPGVVVYYAKNRSGEITFSLEHPEAEARVFCIFDGNDTARFKLKTLQKHIAPGSKSSLIVKSVLRDKSSLDYSGNIIIEKEAQQADASLENRNLLLSDKAQVTAIPNLEILANDVKCSHAVTTSSVNPDDLFYLATRGIETKKAETLLISGFLDDVQRQIGTL